LSLRPFAGKDSPGQPLSTRPAPGKDRFQVRIPGHPGQQAPDDRIGGCLRGVMPAFDVGKVGLDQQVEGLETGPAFDLTKEPFPAMGQGAPNNINFSEKLSAPSLGYK